MKNIIITIVLLALIGIAIFNHLEYVLVPNQYIAIGLFVCIMLLIEK